jgi:hypothetical protein
MAKTPPALKYLLNERAATAGALADLERLAPDLRAKVRAAQAKLESAQAALAEVEAERIAREEDLVALDTVLGSMHSDWREPPAVRAWAGKYGPRGARAAFTQGLIRDVGSYGISPGDIVRAVVEHYGLVLHTRRDRESLRTSIWEQLRAWKAAGLIRSRPGPKNTVILTWDWGPTGEDLLRLAGVDGDPVSHASGSEVGRQRTGGLDG